MTAFLGVGLPVATESGLDLPLPRVPALFVVGEKDTLGPPVRLREFLGSRGQIVEIPEADHFFEGRLDALEEAIGHFLGGLLREEAV